MLDTYAETVARLTELEAVAAAATGDMWEWDSSGEPGIVAQVQEAEPLAHDRFVSVLDISHYRLFCSNEDDCQMETEIKEEDKVFITSFDPATVKELLRLARLGVNLSEALGEQGVAETLKYVETDPA